MMNIPLYSLTLLKTNSENIIVWFAKKKEILDTGFIIAQNVTFLLIINVF